MRGHKGLSRSIKKSTLEIHGCSSIIEVRLAQRVKYLDIAITLELRWDRSLIQVDIQMQMYA